MLPSGLLRYHVFLCAIGSSARAARALVVEVVLKVSRLTAGIGCRCHVARTEVHRIGRGFGFAVSYARGFDRRATIRVLDARLEVVDVIRSHQLAFEVVFLAALPLDTNPCAVHVVASPSLDHARYRVFGISARGLDSVTDRWRDRDHVAPHVIAHPRHATQRIRRLGCQLGVAGIAVFRARRDRARRAVFNGTTAC